MRALAIATVAVALVGCNPELSNPQGETTAGLGYAQPDPTVSCFSFQPGAQPLMDRWGGQRGYIIYRTLSHYCYPENAENIAVIGLDPTMTQEIFQTEVGDMNGVAYYQNLPGTIPFQCAMHIELGMVGSQNTDTGGNKGCAESVCIPNAEIDNFKASCTPCQPLTEAQACNGSRCGYALNGCAQVVSCGTCRVGFACEDGSCVRDCSVKTCPKGSYFNPDDCRCEKGLPQ